MLQDWIKVLRLDKANGGFERWMEVAQKHIK
jgi:hypothetical protein